MKTLEVHAIEILDDTAPVPLSEVLASTRLERTYLVNMVEAGVVTPVGATIEQWTFVRADLRRLRIARRLIEDLDVNAAGVALILDLLEERNALLSRVRAFDLFNAEF
jgi:chaperone modulatory protein CbpM